MPLGFAKVETDSFGGVTVRLQDGELALSPAAFRERLRAALGGWRTGGTRGVWLPLPVEAASFVPVAVSLGFEYHHAKKSYIMLTAWLPAPPNTLPEYPHHQLGVGGMVLNRDGEVLCIQEKRGMTAGMTDFWKLPGGLVDHGEDLQLAVVREVLEETGIRTVFRCVASARETHSGPFGTTDIYMICCLALDPKAYESGFVPTPAPQQEEIANASWKPLRPLLASKYYTRGLYGDLLRTAAAVAVRLENGEAGLGLAQTQQMGLAKKLESLYYAGVAPPWNAEPKAKL